jgi:hypothetical protein
MLNKQEIQAIIKYDTVEKKKRGIVSLLQLMQHIEGITDATARSKADVFIELLQQEVAKQYTEILDAVIKIADTQIYKSNEIKETDLVECCIADSSDIKTIEDILYLIIGKAIVSQSVPDEQIHRFYVCGDSTNTQKAQYLIDNAYGAKVEWVALSDVWSAVVLNSIIYITNENINEKEILKETSMKTDEASDKAVEQAIGPMAQFKKDVCALKQLKDFDNQLRNVMQTLVEKHCKRLGQSNVGTLCINSDGQGTLLNVKYKNTHEVEYIQGIEHCLLTGTDAERYAINDLLQATAIVLDEYCYKTYGKGNALKKVVQGAPTERIQHKVDQNVKFGSYVALQDDLYLCNLQSCFNSKLCVYIDEIEINGSYKTQLRYENVGKNAVVDYTKCFIHLLWWVLYKRFKTVENLQKTIDTDYSNCLVKVIAQNIITRYGAFLFYNYTVHNITDVYIDFEARFGVCVDTIKYKVKDYLSFVKEEGYYQTHYAIPDKNELFAMPNTCAALKLNCKFIINPEAYYATPDFGYKDNHILYKKGVARKAPVVIGKKINGTYMTTDVFTATDKFGLPIFSGSRSGKGVLTNNICAGWLARGYGVIYIDCKPEQATALWHFEDYFNKKYKLERPLKLIAVDCTTDGSVLPDTMGGGKAPRARAVYGMPKYLYTNEFEKICQATNADELYEKIRNGELFTVIHAFKLLQLVFGLINSRTSASQEIADLAQELGKDYIYVVWDELENCYNKCGAVFKSVTEYLKNAQKYKNTIETKLTKKTTDPNDRSMFEQELKILTESIAYFTHIVKAYNAWGNLSGNIALGFKGIKSHTLKANVRFLTITQSLPYTEDKWPADNLMPLFSSSAYIEGKNAVKAGARLDMHYASLACYKNDKELRQQANLIQGDLNAILRDDTSDTEVAMCDTSDKEGKGISGYFGYISAGNLDVFKSCLSLLENDYDESNETHIAKAGGGPCGLSIGDGAVAGLLSRVPENLREYVLTHDIYTTDAQGNSILNSEIGFAGTAEWLMQRSAEKIDNWHGEMQALVDSINLTYDNLLLCVNYCMTHTGKCAYSTLEDYLADMSYDGMLEITNAGLKPANSLQALQQDIQNNGSYTGEDEDFIVMNTDAENETENIIDMPSVKNEAPEDSHYNNDSVIDTEDLWEDDVVDDVNKVTAEDTLNRETLKEVKEVEDSVFDINNVSVNTNKTKSSVPTNVIGKDKTKHNVQTANLTDAEFQRNTAAFTEIPANFDVSDIKKTANNTEKGNINGAYARKKITELIRACIELYVNNDLTLITKFKIDSSGKLYINDTCINPTLTNSINSTEIIPAIRDQLAKGNWGDYYVCGDILLYSELRELDIASNRAVTCSKEMGIGTDITKIKTSIACRRRFPKFETLLIDGRPVDLDNQETTKTVSSTLGALGNGTGVASLIWDKCKPLRFCTKALGYAVGLKVFWGAAALLGPIGLLMAGVGTAAMAMNEYDIFQQDRTNSGYTNKDTPKMIQTTGEEVSPKRKK